MKDIDQLAINTLRINGCAAVNKANSGHPGIVLSAAPMLHTLATRHLNYDPLNPKWINRDRLILSAGHGSALLYSYLRLLKIISQEDLENFRQLLSKTPGHPESHLTPGVEATTGPLGQGIAMAVGMAVAEAHLAAKFSEINHYVYVICGDGDLEEGISYEAMSFAGKQKLSKLIVLHDSNDIQLDTEVSAVFDEKLQMRMEALGWNYQLVTKNEVNLIDAAIARAKKSDKPSFIEIKTIIGEGATKQATPHVHGAPLGSDFETVKKYYNWNYGDFEVPAEVEKLYQETIFARGNKAQTTFKPSKELENFLQPLGEIHIDLDLKTNEATRNTSGEVIKYLNANFENAMGGSADLSGSTKIYGGDGIFAPNNRKGRNILFGVREFAMAAIGNGIALHSNFRPFVSTFFVFSDYLKPAIRLAALMQLPTLFIFTHDSVFVGEDGPTHQPIEHIAMMRSIPNINFIRPADEKEVLGAYELAFSSTQKPTVIALTRQNIKSLGETSKKLVKQGHYEIVKNNSKWTLVASGSELANATIIGKELGLNVISISNSSGAVTWDINYAISIEAGTTYGLAKYAKYNLGIDAFGESGEGNAVYKFLKLDIDSLKTQIIAIINK